MNLNHRNMRVKLITEKHVLDENKGKQVQL